MAARIATSTITHAQQILYLDRGRITKTGTHTERLGLGRRTPESVPPAPPTASIRSPKTTERPNDMKITCIGGGPAGVVLRHLGQASRRQP